MRLRLLAILAINVVMFLAAGLMQWRYYTYTDHAPGHSAGSSQRPGELQPDRLTKDDKAEAAANKWTRPLVNDVHAAFAQAAQRVRQSAVDPAAEGASLPALAQAVAEAAMAHDMPRIWVPTPVAVKPVPQQRISLRGFDSLRAGRMEAGGWPEAVSRSSNASAAYGLLRGQAAHKQSAVETAGGYIPGDGRGDELVDAALLLFCFNRTAYLSEALESLAGLPGLQSVSVYLSQDGVAQPVADLVQTWEERLSPPHSRGFHHWQRDRRPLLRPNQAGHAWLTQHYKWALDRVFLEQGHSHVIIVEDDMKFSPDFIHYFRATAALLDQDPTLWCVSTWNDNGMRSFDWDPRRLFRTSYFPGLGWMMRRSLWVEIGPSWPLDNWDHWMRLNSTSKGRECIAPEVNRNWNIGEKGANMDKRMFRRYLSQMSWNQDLVEDFGDLSYLREDRYDSHFRDLLARSEKLEWAGNGLRTASAGKVYLVTYLAEQYMALSRQLRVWPFPRGHHRHLAVIPYRGSLFLLADARFCPLLPAAERVAPADGLVAVAAPRDMNCENACLREQMACRERDFAFINSCEELRKHFACERGCTVELGPDVPNYVVDGNMATYQTCLVTQQQSKCCAQHPSTARLCPCVPAGR